MDLIEQIDQYLLDRPKREQKKRWYPTDMLRCGRQLFYKKLGEEPSDPVDAGAIWKMEIGNFGHELIFQFIKEAIDPAAEEELEVMWSESKGEQYPFDLPSEYDEQWEAEHFPEWLLSGRIDIVFTEDGIRKGVECKTSFGQGIKQIQQLGQPKDDHLAQCVAYLSVTDLEEMWLFYFGRDNAYRTLFKVWIENGVPQYAQSDTGWNQRGAPELRFDRMMWRLRTLETAIKDKGPMPRRDFQVAIKNGEIKDKFVVGGKTFKSDWQCRYCPYLRMCWIDQTLKYADGDNRADFHG